YLALVPLVLGYLLPDHDLALRLASLLGAVYFGRRVVVHWHLNGGLRHHDASLYSVLVAAAVRSGLLLINTPLGSCGICASFSSSGPSTRGCCLMSSCCACPSRSPARARPRRARSATNTSRGSAPSASARNACTASRARRAAAAIVRRA